MQTLFVRPSCQNLCVHETTQDTESSIVTNNVFIAANLIFLHIYISNYQLFVQLKKHRYKKEKLFKYKQIESKLASQEPY